jgi:DNA-binding protein YbaB
VYDPHIVPAFEKWQAQYAASRARRRQGRGPVTVEVEGKGKAEGDDPTNSGTELRSIKRKPDTGDEAEEQQSEELENMVAKEVNEWRTGVDRSQSALRHRTPAEVSGSALEEVRLYVLELFQHILNIY